MTAPAPSDRLGTKPDCRWLIDWSKKPFDSDLCRKSVPRTRGDERSEVRCQGSDVRRRADGKQPRWRVPF